MWRAWGRDGTLARLYLSAWLDARTGIFTGWYVQTAPKPLALDSLVFPATCLQNVGTANNR